MPRPTRCITGSPGALAAASAAGDSDRPLGKGSLHVRGDAEVAAAYRELFASGAAGSRGGTVPRASAICRRGGSRISAGRRSRSCGAPAAPSARTSPNICRRKAATCRASRRCEEFLRGVDRLRETADRVEARLARLERLGPPGGPGTADALARRRRLLQIQRALVRHGLDDFVRATHLYRPFRFLFFLSPWTWFQRSAGTTRGERLRLALEELGPDLREIRPGAVDAPRSAPGRHRR